MKKLLLPLMLILLALPAVALAQSGPLSGSGSSASVSASGNCPPGCNCDVMNKIIDQSQVARVRDHATMHQIMEQPRDTGSSSSTETNGKPMSNLDLACFDQALKLSSLLSGIFSALKMPNISASISQGSFCGILQYPNGINASIGTHLNSLIGAWRPNWANLLPALNFSMCTPPVNFQLPHLSLGGSLGGCLPNINLGGNTLSPFKPVCVHLNTPGVNCNALSSFWKGGNHSAKGNGIIPGVPYMNMKDFLNSQAQTASNDIANVTKIGTFFKQQVSQPNAQTILQRALNNLGTLQPGHLPSWPTVPNVSANSNVHDIIQSMQ